MNSFYDLFFGLLRAPLGWVALFLTFAVLLFLASQLTDAEGYGIRLRFGKKRDPK